MQTEKFIRKVRPVEAVKVSVESLEEIASWCGGLVIPAPGLAGENNSEPYVHVPVRNPRRPEDKQAFPGMWVIKEDYNNYRVITNKQFKNSYDGVTKTKQNQVAPTPAKNPGAAINAMAAKSDPSGLTAVTPKPTQVGAVQVVPGTPPEAGSALTTGKVSVENTIEAAAAEGLITQEDAAEARSEIAEVRDEAAHDAVARDIAAAEIDGDMVQLGQPIVVDTLCDECGSAVVDGLCTNTPTHIVNSASEIAQTPRILPGV